MPLPPYISVYLQQSFSCLCSNVLLHFNYKTCDVHTCDMLQIDQLHYIFMIPFHVCIFTTPHKTYKYMSIK